MSKKVLLISESEIKNQTIIEKNVDAKVLSKVILNVQEINLKPILGKVLYDTVIDEVYAFTTSATAMTAIYKTLLEDYIQPYLAHQVVCDFLVVNNYKISNKGMQKLRDDASDNLSSDELEYTKNYFDNYTSKYKLNLIEFLKDNNLITCNTDTDTTSNSTGWYLN